MRLLSLLTAIVVVLPAAAGAQDKPKLDLTGTWQFSVQSELGSGSPTVVLKQQGDSLTGRYISQSLGERELTGAIKGNKVEFGFEADAGGQKFSMWFAGELDGADAMSGAIDFAGMGSGTFTGRRRKP